MTYELTVNKLNEVDSYIEGFKQRMGSIYQTIPAFHAEYNALCEKYLGNACYAPNGNKATTVVDYAFQSLLDVYIKTLDVSSEDSQILEYMYRKYTTLDLATLDNIASVFSKLCNFYFQTIQSYAQLNVKSIDKINKAFSSQLSAIEGNIDPVALKLFKMYFKFNSVSSEPRVEYRSYSRC